MTSDATRAEIKQIEKDGRFAGKEADAMPYWERQAMLKRRSALYERKGPDDPEREKASDVGMYDALKAQGITNESLDADQEKFAARDWQEEIEKARHELELRFGGAEEAKEHIITARNILKRFGKPEDSVFLEESGLGNDPDFIEALSKVGRILEAKWAEDRESKKRGKKK
jgi:hypothetical protein